ncbi:MAG: hypothetical protein QOK21_2842 [Solirubrobacteraceae bacterium]|jgi:hypothetical protein|nr:hypothetical protein [Solirubrobacteraceae bacterium]
MRATLTTASAVALLAASAGSAAARPDIPSARTDAALHAQAMHAQGVHDTRLRRHQTTVASSGTPAAAPTVRVAPLADGGFEWADAGIGAGLAAGLLLSAAGVAAVRRHPPVRTR